MVKREELKKYLEEKGFEATDCLPYYDEKILDLISKRVKDEARRETLREVKGKFDKIWDNIRGKGMECYSNTVIEFSEWLEKEFKSNG